MQQVLLFAFMRVLHDQRAIASACLASAASFASTADQRGTSNNNMHHLIMEAGRLLASFLSKSQESRTVMAYPSRSVKSLVHRHGASRLHCGPGGERPPPPPSLPPAQGRAGGRLSLRLPWTG